MSSPFDAIEDAVRSSPPDIEWSVCVRDLESGEVLAGVDPETVLPTASIGKLYLLAEVGHQIEQGEVSLEDTLARTTEDAVADSGLWQHLDVNELTVRDLATLVGAVSDNLATNVLLRRLGLEQVQITTTRLGLRDSGLHDRVRPERTQDHPPALSSGSAAELSWFFAELGARRVISARVSELLLGWLSHDADVSMVASAFGLDPLAHTEPDRELLLRHKTGTDPGVRSDAGLLIGPGGGVAYAVLARWDDQQGDRRDAVLSTMRIVGEALRDRVSQHISRA